MAMFDPNAPMQDFESQQAVVDRQKMMAERLRQQTMEQPGTRMVSGIAVQPHWLERLVPLLNAHYAGKADADLRKSTEDLGVQQSAAANNWRSSMPTAKPAVPENAPADGVGPTMPGEAAQPVTRGAILKHTMAGLANPRTAKEAGMVNQSLTSELTRAEDQTFKDAQARTAAQERLELKKEALQAQSADLQSKLEDKALTREQQKAYQDQLLTLQNQWKMADNETKRYLGEMGNQTRRDIAESRTGMTKPLPSAQSKAWLENSNAINNVNKALDLVEKNPGAFGAKRVLPEAINNRVDPQGVPARALVADIGSLKIHDRSGAAVTAAETPRLMPFIPRTHDNPDVIKAKLKSFREQYEAMQNEIVDFAGNQGYASPRKTGSATVKNPSAGAPVERIIGGKRYINNGGGPNDWHQAP